MSVKNYVVLIASVLVLDYFWLHLQTPMYNQLVRGIQGTEITINLWGAFLSYLCIILSLVIFVIPIIKDQYLKDPSQNLFQLCVYYGGLMGLLMYGVFNSTNLAIFRNYDLKVGLIDTLWGGCLYTIGAYLFLSLSN